MNILKFILFFQRADPRSGMSLIEVVTASAVLLLFLGGATALMFQTSRALEDTQRRSEATMLAWSRVERARRLDFDVLDTLTEPAPGTQVNALGLPDADGRFLRATAITDHADQAIGLPMRRVRVSVIPIDRMGRELSPEVVETFITQIASGVDP